MRTPARRRPGAPVALALVALTLLAGGANAAQNGRLDRDVVPTFQTVKLKLDPSLPDYSGSVRIDVQVTAPATSFRLFAKAMDVISVRLTAGETRIPVTFEVGEDGGLTVRSAEPIPAGAYGLDIDFMNDFDRRANSLYRLKSGEEWYCYTQFEAVAAREAFPCWDEPEFKIPFQLTVIVPDKCSAVSNTPIARESTIGGQRTIAFARTKPLPTYLVAMAVGPFEFVPIRGMSVPGRVVTTRGTAAMAREAAAIAPPILKALERYFGRPYPYEKLDLLAVPEFAAGAMENAGAITFRDEILLVDPATAGVRQRQRLASITAHEMAHMWFGDLVTMEWWDDLWLNESFASWMGDKVAHEIFPQYNTPVRELGGTQSAMNTDAGVTTRAVRQPVEASANIDRLFDELSYQKGQAVLGMLENWLGPDVFRRGVIAYLKNHEWKNATASDLWAALSNAAGRDITPATLSFLDQGGVPLVSADLQPDGTLRLRQQRFLNYGVEAPGGSWKIPVVLRYPDGQQVRTQSVMLEQSEQIVKLEGASTPAWIHPNAQERGYYRWFMPPAALDALAREGARAMDPRERVGFLNNLSALFDAGLLGADEFMATLERFTDDPSPDVVSSVIARLDKVKDTFITPDLDTPFANTVNRILQPSLKRFGLEKKRGEPEAVSLMRPNLLMALGVYAHDREVKEWARLGARRYLVRPDSLDATVAGTALNLAAREGDLVLFEAYRLKFETAKVPSERARYLTALGYFRRSPMLDRSLQYVMSGQLRPQEFLTIPMTIAKESEELKLKVWRWFQVMHVDVAKKVPPFYLSDLPSFARCCDRERIADAKAFFSTPDASFPGTQEELAKVVERIGDCAGLRERQLVPMASYLSRGGAAPPARMPGP